MAFEVPLLLQRREMMDGSHGAGDAEVSRYFAKSRRKAVLCQVVSEKVENLLLTAGKSLHVIPVYPYDMVVKWHNSGSGEIVKQ